MKTFEQEMQHTYENFHIYRNHWFMYTKDHSKRVVRVKAYSVNGVWMWERKSIYGWKEFNNSFIYAGA